jgi:hypothetical protein
MYTLILKNLFLPGVGSEPGSSRFHLISHFHHFTAEPQRLPKSKKTYTCRDSNRYSTVPEPNGLALLVSAKNVNLLLHWKSTPTVKWGKGWRSKRILHWIQMLLPFAFELLPAKKSVFRKRGVLYISTEADMKYSRQAFYLHMYVHTHTYIHTNIHTYIAEALQCKHSF